tara:strand:+ start:1088 stop:1516 length:429 start_codon:yes stop_codon:yes gene_type:complete
MATKREQIIAALKTQLAGTTGVGTRIFRSRPEAFKRADTPSIVIEPVADQPTIRNSNYLGLNWTLTVRVVVITRGNIPDNIADPTIESMHPKLVNDPTLGGLALDVRPSSTSFEFLEADQPAGIIMCEYEVDYRSSYNNLSS